MKKDKQKHVGRKNISCEQEVVLKKWGFERIIVNTDSYCGKVLFLSKGYRCSLHYHKNKDETFYILSGSMLLEADGEKIIMNRGESIRIFPNCKHRFSGIEECKFIEFSTHHEDSDSYREEQSGAMPKE